MAIVQDMPVWPGDPRVAITPASVPGDPSVSQLIMGTHTGTHVDPPGHFFPGAASVDELPLDVLAGPAWLAHLPGSEPPGSEPHGPEPARRGGPPWPPSHALSAAALANAGIPPGVSRLLLRTRNSDGAPGAAFDPSFAGLAEDAARWLIGAGVRLVGVDGPSVEPYDSPGEPVHRLLLGAGVIVVEGLALGLPGLAPGPYHLCCLPLKIAQGDGAPARVILTDAPDTSDTSARLPKGNS